MSGFDAGWLALREPYDHAARAVRPLQLVQAWAKRRRTLRIVDLGSGTGSTLRALAPLLGPRQDWTLVEHDPALIEAGSALLKQAEAPWRYRRADLATELAGVIETGADLVTGSALIDLVGERWLDQLVSELAQGGSALLMALSYDGRLVWTPEDPDDALIKRCFDRHQQTEKGLGPALGPRAAGSLERALSALPGTVCSAVSDWVLGPEDRPMQTALVEGMAGAASEIDPSLARHIAAWRDRRTALIAAGRSALRLGHRDVAYMPSGGSSAA